MSLVAFAALAQSDRGTITGTTLDPTGAVVPNASVEARHAGTGAMYKVKSTETGNYTLAELPAGVYQIVVSAPGFKKYVRQGLTVQVAQVLRIDIAMEVGEASESVTVQADAALLKTESGELSHNVTNARVDDLPVLGIGPALASNLGVRNPQGITQFVPGSYVSPTGTGSTFRINGAPPNTGAIRIDGQDGTNGFTGTSTMYQPSVDALQEVSVQTSNYAAEYGTAGGGVYNYTMKSGTNQFHGTAYDYYVNEAFNAGTPFTSDGSGHLLRPVQRRNNYGVTFGGPVWIPHLYDGRNKTFFFFNWEQYLENELVNNLFLTVPTPAMRNGNFSQVLTGRNLGTDPLGRPIPENTIYDPNTEQSVAGQIVRSPFPSNTIPLTRMDSVALKIQALIPQPFNSSGINNLISPWVAPQWTIIPAVKLDQLIGAKTKVSLYWSTAEGKSSTSASNGPGGADGLQPNPISATRGTYLESYTTRLNFDQTLTPTLLAHWGIGYIHHRQNNVNASTLSYDAPAQLGLTGLPLNPGIFPSFNGLSAPLGGMQNMGPQIWFYTGASQPTAVANLTWVKGNHTYKAGGEFRSGGYPGRYLSGVDGVFGMSAAQTGLPSTNGQALSGTVGFPYASFLLGAVNQLTVNQPEHPRVGKHDLAGYVQDSWKITRKITLDYGLRYDFSTYEREQYGRMPDFSAAVPNPAFGNVLGAPIFEGSGPGRCNCQFAHNYPYAYGPRLGLAYQVLPKTVLRAGFGIVYASTANTSFAAATVATETLVVPAGSTGFDEPVMTLAKGVQVTPVWPNFSPGQFPNLTNLNVVDANGGRPARQSQWSIGVQREVFTNLLVEAAYVGDVGAWWPSTNLVSYNAPTPQQLRADGVDVTVAADRTLLSSQIGSSLAASRGFNRPPFAGFPALETVAQSLLQYPQYGTLTPLWAPLGRTWYNALQTKVTQRLTRGLSFTTLFTWQKSLQMGTEAGAQNDVFNRPQNKYLSSLDQSFVLAIQANYTVPGLPKLGGHTVLSNAGSLMTKDWTLGTVLQYSSGIPILAPISTNALSSVLFRSTFANRVAGVPLFTRDINCHCFDPNTTFVLNPAAWTQPAPGTFGTAAAYYDDYRYQRRPIENISIARKFAIKERLSLTIRGEFTNMFNRTEPANPTSTNSAATQVRNAAGQTVSGFGYISPASPFGLSRQGMVVARFQF
jgi:hypothetical protein